MISDVIYRCLLRASFLKILIWNMNFGGLGTEVSKGETLFFIFDYNLKQNE